MVKRKLWLAACGLALLGTLSGCANFTQTVRNSIPNPGQQREMRYDFAQLQERNGDLHKAEKAYRELADAKPKEAKFHHRLGIVLVRQGKLEDGVTELTKASELDQENALILNDLGYAQMLRGEYAAAETAIRKSLELDAKDTRARNNLALVLGYEGKMRESYEQFRLNNSEAEARANLAYVHTQRGELIAASKEYDQSLSKNPENKAAAEALVQLNSLQREMNADAAARGSEGLTQNRCGIRSGNCRRLNRSSRNTKDIGSPVNVVEPSRARSCHRVCRRASSERSCSRSQHC